MKQIYLLMQLSNDYGGRYDGAVAAFTDLELAKRCCRMDQEIFGVLDDDVQSIPLYEADGEAADILALITKEREEEEEREKERERARIEAERIQKERKMLALKKAEIQVAMSNPETVLALSEHLKAIRG